MTIRFFPGSAVFHPIATCVALFLERTMQFAVDDMRRAAKSLVAEYGDMAEQEAEKRFSEAEKAGRKLSASFWRDIQAIVAKRQNK